MKTLIFIPARGGSKGIPQKNLTSYLGQPLIKQTIDVALKFKEKFITTDIIVSTDSQEIEDYVSKFQQIIISRRPNELATDQSKTIDALLYTLSFYSNSYHWDRVITLQPTSPLRKFHHLLEAANIQEKNRSKSLISCYSFEGLLNKLYLIQNNISKPIKRTHNAGLPRQNEPKVYVRNGAIYITDTSYLIVSKNIISESPIIYEMSKKSSIDINDFQDLAIAEFLEAYED
jgi:N-acylneuraminate cytidylyltransferase